MSLLQAALTTGLLVSGTLLMIVSALGILRMPDLFMRMQAATKGAALAAGLILLASLVYFWDLAVTARVIAAIVFIFITLPIAAHLLSRAAYLTGTMIWQDTKTGLPDPYEEEPELLDDENPPEET
jgi:multicomponent Na+:H+ antiporter subunit G